MLWTHNGFMENQADAHLVELCRNGNRAAFSVLVLRHRPLAIRLCQRLLRDEVGAEDVVQEAVLQAWLSLGKLRGAERFGPWLAGIALHLCRRWLRDRSHETWSLEALLGGSVVVPLPDSDPPPAEVVELRDLGSRVRRAIDELPRAQRSAVALFYLADLSHAEVAALLGIQPGTVKTRLHKARARLRQTLLDLWNEECLMQEEKSVDFVDVDVDDVRAPTEPGQRRVVLLAERGGNRLLPVWVGGYEGDSIAISLLQAQTRRPLTFAFTVQLLSVAGARLREVRIDRLVEETYYAQALVDTNGAEAVVDARPSDAIALALESGAPIRVNADVMQRAAVTREQLAETKQVVANGRSARAQADAIRERVTQPRANWAASSLF